MKKKLEVKCPQCEIQFSYYKSEYRPFCSERCQQIDLGNWFNESYSVAGSPADIDSLDERDDSSDESY